MEDLYNKVAGRLAISLETLFHPKVFLCNMSCFQNSSFPKVVAKSLNIFEQFQVLVKLQIFSFNKNYLRFLVFQNF